MNISALGWRRGAMGHGGRAEARRSAKIRTVGLRCPYPGPLRRRRHNNSTNKLSWMCWPAQREAFDCVINLVNQRRLGSTRDLKAMTMTKKFFLACAAAAVASITLGGIVSEASAGGRVLPGGTVTNKPIVHNTVTLRNCQGRRIPGRSLGNSKGQRVCNRTPGGLLSCRVIN